MDQTSPHLKVNQELLEIIPRVDSLCEVGCSYGALAEAYKKYNNKCNYIGIEIDKKFAIEAAKRCDKVYWGNFEEILENSFHLDGINPQCWIFGDVLEHLYDPWLVLRQLHDTMPESGFICACIPNMQHWSIQCKILTGNLFYETKGLLDRTHIRWFTKKSIEEMFCRAGFELDIIKPKNISLSIPDYLERSIKFSAIPLGIDAEELIDLARPLQYVVRAKKISKNYWFPRDIP